MKLKREREEIVRYGNMMAAAGLTTGTGGNLSVFNPGRGLVAVSPSGIAYPKIRPEDVVLMDLSGTVVEGGRRPSSEFRFHLALYGNRSEIRAVVHTHSVYATTLACLHWEIPPVHYLVGFAGKKVPLAPYATFGSPELADGILESMDGGNAVLLANHGMVAVGASLPSAFATAEEIEFVARVYYLARSAGTPHLIDGKEMDRVIEKFGTYGQKR
jgi:L-fuculose-phosphate aldolase